MQIDQSSHKKTHHLTLRIMLGLVVGIGVGYVCHEYHDDIGPQYAADIEMCLSIIIDIFLRLIKMIIAPLVFATIVSGIASLSEPKAVGRIAFKALIWFFLASVTSLGLGLVFANFFAPGADLGLTLPAADAATNLKTSGVNFKDFFTHVFPTSMTQAMASNEVLQILVFSVFFGCAITALKGSQIKLVTEAIEGLVKIMLKITDFVMLFAPFGVFASIALIITKQGLSVLITYGKFIGSFYVGLAVLWVVLLLVGTLFLGGSLFRLVRLLRQPMLVAFSTASSEAAFPRTLEQLSKFGVSERVSGFVLPLGYSFNLDGSMMYQAFAALFIAQAYHIDMSLWQQFIMLLWMMLTSKGIAGVPRASLVVVAATIHMFGLPAAGILLIMGIDQFLDMGRTMTNVIGNGIATSVVAKWEGELRPGLAEEDDDLAANISPTATRI